MKKLIKRCSFATALTVALMAFSASSTAQDLRSTAVKMSDGDLDRVTAGSGASTEMYLFNPGKAGGEPKVNGNHMMCINCDDLFEEGVPIPRTSGFFVVKTGSGKVLIHHPRQSPFPMQAY